MEKEMLVMSIASACLPVCPKSAWAFAPRFLVDVLCCALVVDLCCSGAAVLFVPLVLVANSGWARRTGFAATVPTPRGRQAAAAWNGLACHWESNT